jgi:hypothetical protein
MQHPLGADTQAKIQTAVAGRPEVVRPTIEPKKIIISRVDNSETSEVETYSHADVVARKWVAIGNTAERLSLHVVVVFGDLFVWRSSLSVSREDAAGKHFIQRAIQADWEFNAGVRPRWWPNDLEAERIWGVHCREDRENGRAELARVRLERYDLKPIALAELPPRDSWSSAIVLSPYNRRNGR